MYISDKEHSIHLGKYPAWLSMQKRHHPEYYALVKSMSTTELTVHMKKVYSSFNGYYYFLLDHRLLSKFAKYYYGITYNGFYAKWSVRLTEQPSIPAYSRYKWMLEFISHAKEFLNGVQIPSDYFQ